MLTYLCFCVALACQPAEAVPANGVPKVNLGFDPTTIPDIPSNPKPVARVWTKFIIASDIANKPAEKGEDHSADRLRSAIIQPLLNRFAEKQTLTVSDEEIDQHVNAMRALAEMFPTPEGKKLEHDSPEAKSAARWVGEQLVKQWKISRALYELYGGTVIIQQGNPLEPLGGLHGFLLEMERAKVFEIYDDELKKQFWNYFTRDHLGVVPPEKVDYSVPWWSKPPMIMK